MIDRITTADGVSVTIETRATGAVRLSLDHKYFDVQRVDLTPSQAAALSRALMQAHDIQAARGTVAYVGNAGEGAQGGRPQRLKLTDEQREQLAEAVDKAWRSIDLHMRLGQPLKKVQASRINWLAIVMLGALAGFWGAVGMALNSALQAMGVL